MAQGNLHPITQFIRKASLFFEKRGFEVYEGPEVDTEWYNFDALNVPANHPARDVQDTFWLTDGRLLRTHTSNCQVRYAENRQPPIRVIVPGTVYRNEATDARHESTLTQLEGLYIDKDVKIGHLFETLTGFLQHIYGDSIEVRFRPHHYPFVEPGADVDIKFEGKWLEVLGSGMVHPTVLKNMNIDPSIYSGFAFGMGIDRLVMLEHHITEIRLFRSSDLKFLKQF
ncbi:MAG: Phenylalanine--tRNA ligase alpha subunit [bacterium ADurb.Bin400]|nr:MAG: Phenylalanine--tRNA ligase alpha subunit [bacterium ADurb.Bin400]